MSSDALVVVVKRDQASFHLDVFSFQTFGANQGVRSRRHARGLIDRGIILLNGERASPGRRLDPGDVVKKLKERNQTSCIVMQKDEGVRLSHFLVKTFDCISSRNKAIKMCDRYSRVQVDGVARESSCLLKAGAKVVILPEEAPSAPHVQIKVHFEDEHLAVVYKPPGMDTNGKMKIASKGHTLEDSAAAFVSESKEYDKLPRPMAVHRLDRATQGLVIIAKTSRAHRALHKAFEQRCIKKRYRALIGGSIADSQINDDIGGRRASTVISVISVDRAKVGGHVAVRNGDGTVRLIPLEFITTLDLYPVTGRKHQLRIHLKSMGTPILGDKLYGRSISFAGGLKILCLAALELTFCHPIYGGKVSVAAEEPKDFKSIRDRLVHSRNM